MDKKTIFIIAGVVVAIIAAYFLFFRKNTVPDKAELAAKWEKEVQHNMEWMRKNPDTVKQLNEKIKITGNSFEKQLRDDAMWYATRNGFVNPNA